MNPAESAGDEWIDLGVIVRPHGLSGEMRVRLFDAAPDDVARIVAKTVRVTSPGGQAARMMSLAGSRFHQGCWLVRFAGIADRDAAEVLRDGVLAVRASELWEADAGTYFEYQLAGVEVFDDRDGAKIGTIVRVENNPGNDLLVVRTESGGEIRIPFVAAFLKEIDLPQKRMRLNLPEGLIELNEDEGNRV